MRSNLSCFVYMFKGTLNGNRSNYFYRTLRQSFQEGPAIGPGQDATVEDDNYTMITLCSDQAPDALSQFQDRFRQRIFSERITPALLDQFKFRFDQSMVGHGKWQTVS